ncbi:10810_t:CDS:2 [Dentiscutata erythropus]|uniref:10810_t:CDS:1 n=1 Tax=Dentiscutata erythropus TaxID=1348616 RepID=A0A9N8WC97_9GLOM|nr:10810_t:CDS:2 [Dentiscutata erythropus]
MSNTEREAIHVVVVHYPSTLGRILEWDVITVLRKALFVHIGKCSAENKPDDKGRDVLCQIARVTIVIQCKNWRHQSSICNLINVLILCTDSKPP